MEATRQSVVSRLEDCTEGAKLKDRDHRESRGPPPNDTLKMNWTAEVGIPISELRGSAGEGLGRHRESV